MSKLWSKSNTEELHPAVNKYIISKDLAADTALVPFDIAASKAHALMLSKVGLLSSDESSKLVSALEDLLALHNKQEFVLRQESEDVHTEIENYLIEKLGPLGKKLHVGRSRNDQVLVALRLYTKQALADSIDLTISLAETILDFAQQHEFVPMPGFTHMQHAMPSSIGQWAGAFVESLINDVRILKATYEILNQNPLGSAAGFGTGVPLDREETTRLLNFSKVQINPLFCQNSRSKFDALAISSLLQVMLTLGKVANDTVIFSSQEFGFLKIDKCVTTGSSIMPQKQNLDIMEVLRANVSVVQSLLVQVQTAGLNLISGYNKDVKIGKKAVIDSFVIAQESLKIVELLFKHLHPDKTNLLKAFDDVEIFAADEANKLVAEGMAFRDAYRTVGENLKGLKKQDVEENIRSKKHIGATGNLCLEKYSQILSELKSVKS